MIKKRAILLLLLVFIFILSVIPVSSIDPFKGGRTMYVNQPLILLSQNIWTWESPGGFAYNEWETYYETGFTTFLDVESDTLHFTIYRFASNSGNHYVKLIIDEGMAGDEKIKDFTYAGSTGYNWQYKHHPLDWSIPAGSHTVKIMHKSDASYKKVYLKNFSLYTDNYQGRNDCTGTTCMVRLDTPQWPCSDGTTDIITYVSDEYDVPYNPEGSQSTVEHLTVNINYDNSAKECMCRNDNVDNPNTVNCYSGFAVSPTNTCWAGASAQVGRKCCGDNTGEEYIAGDDPRSADGTSACCSDDDLKTCVWNYGCYATDNPTELGTETDGCDSDFDCCSDGIDNDCDTLIDFDDNDCSTVGCGGGQVKVGDRCCNIYAGETFFGSAADPSTCVQGLPRKNNELFLFEPLYVPPISTDMDCRVAVGCSVDPTNMDFMLGLEKSFESKVQATTWATDMCCDIPLSPQCVVECGIGTCTTGEEGILTFSSSSNLVEEYHGSNNFPIDLCCKLNSVCASEYELYIRRTSAACNALEECLITIDHWSLSGGGSDGGSYVAACEDPNAYPNKLCIKMVPTS